jgi:hypothetical protein
VNPVSCQRAQRRPQMRRRRLVIGSAVIRIVILPHHPLRVLIHGVVHIVEHGSQPSSLVGGEGQWADGDGTYMMGARY